MPSKTNIQQTNWVSHKHTHIYINGQPSPMRRWAPKKPTNHGWIKTLNGWCEGACALSWSWSVLRRAVWKMSAAKTHPSYYHAIMWLTTPRLAFKLWLPSVHTHGPNIDKNTFKLKGPSRKLLSLSLSLSLSHTHRWAIMYFWLLALVTYSTGVCPQRGGKEGVGSKQQTFQELNVIPVLVPKKHCNNYSGPKAL
jgi:hypothetical protein